MSRWENFCVVGIGGHARTKLLPGIAENGQKVVGLVSRQPSDTLPDGPIYPTVEAALPHLPPGTAILISSPPASHYIQAKAALSAGFDVFVEKPAFVSVDEAQDLATLCATNGTVLVEAFMQRYTALYSLLLEHIANNPPVVIDISFLIPAQPQGTFRNAEDLSASSLYDIGCYILALLDDIGINPAVFDIADVRDAGTMTEALELFGHSGTTVLRASIGVDAEYVNRVRVVGVEGDSTTFEPLFYGRPGTKMIGDRQIEDCNGFAAMLAVPREHWLANQPERLTSMIAVTKALGSLALQLAEFRLESRP